MSRTPSRLRKPTLPRSLKIGGFVYAVEVMDPLVAEERGIRGLCNHSAQVISVDTRHHHHAQADTLLHEALHGIYWDGDLHASDSEEKVVSVLGHRLLQLLRDNPDLVRFVTA